jgi:hypothetical protein
MLRNSVLIEEKKDDDSLINWDQFEKGYYTLLDHFHIIKKCMAIYSSQSSERHNFFKNVQGRREKFEFSAHTSRALEIKRFSHITFFEEAFLHLIGIEDKLKAGALAPASIAGDFSDEDCLIALRFDSDIAVSQIVSSINTKFPEANAAVVTTKYVIENFNCKRAGNISFVDFWTSFDKYEKDYLRYYPDFIKLPCRFLTEKILPSVYCYYAAHSERVAYYENKSWIEFTDLRDFFLSKNLDFNKTFISVMKDIINKNSILITDKLFLAGSRSFYENDPLKIQCEAVNENNYLVIIDYFNKISFGSASKVSERNENGVYHTEIAIEPRALVHPIFIAAIKAQFARYTSLKLNSLRTMSRDKFDEHEFVDDLRIQTNTLAQSEKIMSSELGKKTCVCLHALIAQIEVKGIRDNNPSISSSYNGNSFQIQSQYQEENKDIMSVITKLLEDAKINVSQLNNIIVSKYRSSCFASSEYPLVRSMEIIQNGINKIQRSVDFECSQGERVRRVFFP